MTKPLLFTGLLMLMACPTPPTPNNSPNSTPGSNAAPTPSGNNGAMNSGQQGNPDGQGNQGGQAPTPNGSQGNGNQGGQPPSGGGGGANQTGNPDGPPPGSVAAGPGEAEEKPMENQELKVPSDEDIEKDGSIMGVFNDLGGQDLPAQFTQKSVERMKHVTLSGKITCDGEGCDVPFVLRITPSFQPTEEDGPLSENLKGEGGGIITSTEIARGGGEYSIKVPKSESNVVLELLMDEDGDGKASIGEKFVIYEGGGGIPINEDRKDIDFQFAPVNLKAPLGGAKPPGGGPDQ